MPKRSGLLLASLAVACARHDPAPLDAADATPTDLVCVGSAVAAAPPARPSVAAPSDGTARWFAVASISYGVGTSAKRTPCGWASRGRNIDGRTTGIADSKAGQLTNPARSTCARAPGAPSGVIADGPDGVDNNFGGRVLTLLASLNACFVDGPTDATFTLVLRLDHVAQGDDAHVPGALYLARDLDHAPSFPALDSWPIDARSLLDGASLGSPVTTFPDGYQVGKVWVSGTAVGRVRLPVFLATPATGCAKSWAAAIDVPIDDAQVVVAIDGSGEEGTLVGVVPAAEAKWWIDPVRPRGPLCPGDTTVEQLLTTLEQAPDLTIAGSDHNDPTSTCDAISIGLGIGLRPTGVPGPIIAPPYIARDRCGNPMSDTGDDAADGG
jgi:hypothetical protein